MFLEFLIFGIVSVLAIIFCKYYKNSAKVNKTAVGKVVGFETNYNISWYPQLSPILEYEIDGKKYRCVMFLLTCEDTDQNRLIYMNKEYTLLYDENNPNRVTTQKRIWW